jgi:2-keto-3-deoxy-L-rhamnonate aldolase RhmA
LRNRIRELFAEQRPARGILVNIPDPAVVELVALAGFDFAFFDLEHSATDLPRLEYLLRTALSVGLGTVVRTPAPRSELTARILDLGVDCVLAPRVSSQADVDHVITTTRFPPLGTRGIAEASRTSDYGAYRGAPEPARPQQVVGVMIEDAGAVADIASIVETRGLDFVFIGPEDLAASMGHMGTRNHPDVEAAVRRVIAETQRVGLPFAMGAGHPIMSVSPEQLQELGVSLILSGRDSNLLLAALRQVHEHGGSGTHL